VILQRQNLWTGALAGALGGIAGVFAMTAQQLLFDHLRGSPVPRPVRELSQRGGRHDIARLKARARRWHLPQKDATIRAAERVSYLVRDKGIKTRQRHIAGVAVHYAFGAIAGAAYGFTAEKYPSTGVAFGLPFGAAVWLLAEELALPVTGLSDTPDKYRLRDHFNALAAHLIFGSTTEIVRRWAREGLRSDDHGKNSDTTLPIGEKFMTKQNSRHTQTQQNTKPEQSDLEADQAGSNTEDQIYVHMEGAETGSDRAPRKLREDAPARNTEPETSAHEGLCPHELPNARSRESLLIQRKRKVSARKR
jgi:hypothetical protein